MYQVEVHELEVVEAPSRELVIEGLHQIPGAVSHPHHDDAEGMLGGLHGAREVRGHAAEHP